MTVTGKGTIWRTIPRPADYNNFITRHIWIGFMAEELLCAMGKAANDG